MGDVITGQLQRGFAADARLCILGERCEAIDFLEHTEVALGALKVIKAAEILIVLIEATNNQFDGVICGWDSIAANRIEQFGPVVFQEIENSDGWRGGLDVGIFEGQDVLVALLSF